MTFRLSTNNNVGSHPPPSYEDVYGYVHRTNQKYVIEIFIMRGDSDKCVVFEDISIKDLTNKRMATLPSTYGDVPLDIFDLKTTFRYWKDLKQGVNSRNSIITSGTMEVSGGSRLNYRSNTAMYPYGRTSDNNALSSIDIVEG
tara:strand:- start:47 stop:475 length:429 start_codon:yes stop_codon:yes gene_type:complete